MSRNSGTALLEPDAPSSKPPPSKPPKVTAGPGLFGARRRNKSRLVIAIVLAVTSLGPLLYMLSLSFQPNGGLLGATVLIPTHPTVQNYVQAWTENSFSRYFVNSLIVAIATVVITVVFASLAAFAFARYQFPLKQTIFYFFLASLAVPNLLLLIPQFLLMDRLHLSTRSPVWCCCTSRRICRSRSFSCGASSRRSPRSTRSRSDWTAHEHSGC